MAEALKKSTRLTIQDPKKDLGFSEKEENSAHLPKTSRPTHFLKDRLLPSLKDSQIENSPERLSFLKNEPADIVLIGSESQKVSLLKNKTLKATSKSQLPTADSLGGIKGERYGLHIKQAQIPSLVSFQTEVSKYKFGPSLAKRDSLFDKPIKGDSPKEDSLASQNQKIKLRMDYVVENHHQSQIESSESISSCNSISQEPKLTPSIKKPPLNPCLSLQVQNVGVQSTSKQLYQAKSSQGVSGRPKPELERSFSPSFLDSCSEAGSWGEGPQKREKERQTVWVPGLSPRKPLVEISEGPIDTYMDCMEILGQDQEFLSYLGRRSPY